METPRSRLGRNSYRLIADALASRISTGEIAPGYFLGTERELQNEFGAGRSTIRKALAALVDEGWVVSVPNKGVFAGRGVRPVSGNRIALVENGSYVLKVLSDRFSQRLREDGLQLERVGGELDYPLEYALQKVLDGDYMGALVWCFHTSPDPDLIARLTRKVAVVALDHRLGKSDTDLVSFDQEAASYEATAHLIRQGARKIGLTGMFDTLDVTFDRIQGYMRAMFDHGLNPDPADFVFVWTSGSMKANVDLMEMRLRSPGRPDAFLVLHDFCVPHVVETALRAGLSLPNDLLLATLGDDLQIEVDGMCLTSIAFDWEVLVVEALDLLKRRVEDLHHPPMVRLAPHRLIVGGLSGAPKEEWTAQPETVSGFRGDLPIPRPVHRYRSRWSIQRDS